MDAEWVDDAAGLPRPVCAKPEPTPPEFAGNVDKSWPVPIEREPEVIANKTKLPSNDHVPISNFDLSISWILTINKYQGSGGGKRAQSLAWTHQKLRGIPHGAELATRQASGQMPLQKERQNKKVKICFLITEFWL